MKKILFSLLVFLMINSCWEKQDHGITAPQIPYYKLSGVIKDIDFDETIDSIKVLIYAVQLVEAPSFEPQVTYSDSGGLFSFDSVFVGNYKMFFYRGDAPVLQKPIFQSYGDSTYTIRLPQVYNITGSQLVYSYDELSSLDNSAFTFHPTNPYTMSFNGHSLSKLKFDSGQNLWTNIAVFQSPVTVFNIKNCAIDFGINSNYTYFTMNTDTLFKFDLHADFVEKTFATKLPDIAKDVHSINDSIYVASINSVFVYDEETLTLQREMILETPVDEEILINAIIKKEQYFWVAEQNLDLLFQCDSNLKVLRTYTPVYHNQLFTIYDMSYDYTGKVWFTD